MTTISFDEFIKQSGGTSKDVKVIGNETQSNNLSPSEGGGYSLKETGQDIMQTGKDIATSFTKRRENVQVGKTAMEQGQQGGIQTLYQTGGQAAGLISDVFGSIIKGGVKALLPQSAETAIKGTLESTTKPIAELDLVKGIIEKYNSLDENTKRNIDATLGFGSLALDATMLGGGKKVAQTAVETGIRGAIDVGEIVSPTLSKTGKILKGAGEATYGLTVPPTEATAKALLSYDATQPTLIRRLKNFVTGVEPIGKKPITEANTAIRQGLVGTEYQIGVQAKKVSNDIWNSIIQPSLNSVKGKVNVPDFFNSIEKQIIKTTKEKIRKDALLEALQSVKDSYKGVSRVSLDTLQKYKEGWAKFIPEATYKGKPIGSALKDVQNMAAQKARDIIYKNIGDTGKQAYLDYGNLQSIISSGIKSTTGDIAKQSLTRDIWQTVMNKAITPVATFGGQILYKTGEGLEIVGKKGAKNIKDIIGK